MKMNETKYMENNSKSVNVWQRIFESYTNFWEIIYFSNM